MTFFWENQLSFPFAVNWAYLYPLLDPEVRFYRGGARVGLVEERHEGAVHSGSLRGTGARAHDDADSYQQDGHAYGAQHHWDGPDIGDNLFSRGVSWLDGASEGTQYRL